MRIYRIASGKRFNVEKLPYSREALYPVISKDAIDQHYGFHYKGYVRKTNDLVGEMYGDKSLRQVIVCTKNKDVFVNAAQVWNHEFYWNSLTPEEKYPDGYLSDLMQASFGSLSDMKGEIIEKGKSLFGSGWLWLLKSGEKLEIETTENAETFVDKSPLLVIDLWEHAYYLDYKHDKEKYLKNIFDILNWDFASNNARR